MDLPELEAFQAVVETGGIGHAAARLHRAQSSITSRIQQLEASLGVPLFHRDGNRLRLTAHGETLVDYTQRLLELAEQARRVVRSDDVGGKIRLGAMESIVASRLPRPLAEFHRRYPEVRVNLEASSSRELVAAVQAGMLDGAIVGENVNPRRFRSVRLYKEELVLAGAQDGVMLQDVDRLATGAILVYHKPGCIFRRRFVQWLDSQHIVPAHVLEFSSFHGMLAAAAGGVGVAMVPHSVLEVFPQRNVLSIRHLPPKEADFQTALIIQGNTHHPALAKLEECLQEDVLRRGLRAKRGTDGTSVRNQHRPRAA